jgi:hypothetical protein
MLPELWSFVPFPTPAINTILHDPVHPSRLVLPLVPNDAARVSALPPCGSVVRQPCRVDPLGVSDEPEPVVPEAPTPLLLVVLGAVVAYAAYRRRTRLPERAAA